MTVGDPTVADRRAESPSRSVATAITATTTMLEDARNNSTMVQLLAGVSRRLETAARRSRLATLGRRLGTAVRRSRLSRGGRTVRRYVTASWCYRWLTTEPDPDVVVIDLRETKTVGPIVTLLDRLLASLERALPSSTTANGAAAVAAFVRDRPLVAGGLVALPAIAASLGSLALDGALTAPLLLVHLFVAALAALGLRSERDLEELRETKTAQVLAAAFEPPEPPEPQNTRESQRPTRPDSQRARDDTERAPTTERSLEEPAAVDGTDASDGDE